MANLEMSNGFRALSKDGSSSKSLRGTPLYGSEVVEARYASSSSWDNEGSTELWGLSTSREAEYGSR